MTGSWLYNEIHCTVRLPDRNAVRSNPLQHRMRKERCSHLFSWSVLRDNASRRYVRYPRRAVTQDRRHPGRIAPGIHYALLLPSIGIQLPATAGCSLLFMLPVPGGRRQLQKKIQCGAPGLWRLPSYRTQQVPFLWNSFLPPVRRPGAASIYISVFPNAHFLAISPSLRIAIPSIQLRSQLDSIKEHLPGCSYIRQASSHDIDYTLL